MILIRERKKVKLLNYKKSGRLQINNNKIKGNIKKESKRSKQKRQLYKGNLTKRI